MGCPLVFSHHCLWRRCCRFKAGLHPGRVASLLQGYSRVHTCEQSRQLTQRVCVWMLRRSHITWTEPTRTQKDPGQIWTCDLFAVSCWPLLQRGAGPWNALQINLLKNTKRIVVRRERHAPGDERTVTPQLIFLMYGLYFPPFSSRGHDCLVYGQ